MRKQPTPEPARPFLKVCDAKGVVRYLVPAENQEVRWHECTSRTFVVPRPVN